MNTIDQRILIPASPDTIWSLLSDIAHNVDWQRDCKDILFLTTTTEGAGMRYRASNNAGRQYVVEITAWYDNVGYAYRIVDGLPYKENRGTIRLQEIAEGTIVQWMFEYELSGFLSGVRNAVSARRNIENGIIESLEKLWKVANSLQDQSKGQYISKSVIREAPDVKARSSYIPRHPSKPQQAEENAVQQVPIIDEPPVEQDDTKPTKSVVAEADNMAIDTSQPPMNEPEFLDGVSSQSEKPQDHATWQPPGSKPDTMQTIDPVTAEHLADEPDIAENQAPPPSFPIIAEDTPSEEPDAIPEPSFELEPIEQEPDDIRDTSTVSVFDLFGVPKPSESQQMPAVKLDEPENIPEPEALPPQSIQQVAQEVVQTPKQPSDEQPKRVGVRLLMRRRLINIRRP